MRSVEFFIPYKVVPKQGDRSGLRTKWNGKPFIFHYRSARVTQNAKALAALTAPHRPSEPLQGALRLRLVFQYPWRASEPRKRRNHAKYKDTRPDLDNNMKQVVDVLESMHFFANDAQIAHAEISKVWTAEQGIQVFLEEIGDERC